MTVSTIQILRSTIGNPVTRTILKGLSNYCEKDRGNRIDVALELYTGVRDNACIKCKLAEKALAKVLETGGKTFGVGERELKERFKDAYWRRGLSSVIRGIAYFGIQRPFVPGAPFQVVWDVTYACNLRCKHCYANAGKPLKDELDTNEAKQAIDRLSKAGVAILAFSGGEPLVRKDFLELARYSADEGMYVAVATNGTLITKEKAREMKKAGIQYVQISVDGATAETHDNFRGIPGAFNRTIKGIKNVVAEDFFVNISTTATHFDYKEIPRIISLCEELGVDWFMAYNFVPTGRGKFMIEHDLTPKEREELLQSLWERLKTSKISILSTAPQFARIALQSEKGGAEKIHPTHFYNAPTHGKLEGLAEFIGGCGAGRFYVAIKPNGDIEPCVFFPLKVGNIKDDDFEELWRNSKVFKDLRNKDALKDNCGSCEYRHYCGGCRARAYSYFNDYMAPDPGCINNLKYFEEIKSSLSRK